ncbi:Early nodulin-like protein [Thalictrum thalictroides]|uniref:Early nodulin-like protein n=1 Tax=Thalictrum thalictroides TaxID=46969 RepID=A0A7J6X355_THATH|nr:Early nodulin-like protein [Thalictrum thalictroides]
MAFDKRAMVLVMVAHIMATMQLTVAVVYKVGDSTGWTTIGNYDYKAWASSKNFKVGDILVFEYNTQFHNVLQVTHDQYRECNTSTPLATHTTGNDSIPIKKGGHFYFLCGIPGHCQSGQKVDIRVASKTAPSPGGAAPSPGGAALSPGGADLSPGGAALSPGGAGTPSTPESTAPAPSVSSPLPSKGAFGFAAVTVAIFAGVVAY